MATTFFKYGILPELLGKWYTRIPFSETQQSIDKPSETQSATLIAAEPVSENGVTAMGRSQER